MKQFFCGLMAALLCFLCGCGAAGEAGKSAAGSAAASSGAETSASGGTLRVYCFSAGKADAILLYTGTSAVLIDTGESGFGREITAYLAQQGISRLDYLIVTHFDQDHVGGAARVLKSVAVGQVLQSDCPKDSDEYAKYTAALEKLGMTALTVRDTLTFTLDGAAYTVYPPQQTTYAESASNNSSLIVSVQYGEKRFLFAGDAETARLKEFLSEDVGSFDFLKVPYHGHWQELLPDLIASVNPAYAVITSSDEEPEDERTTAALKSAGAEVYLTRSAPVLAVCSGTSLEVSYADAGT